MHRIDTPGHDNGLFREYSPATGPGTKVSAEWLSDFQENLCRLIESAGITLSKGDHDQLTQAIAVLSGGGAVGIKHLSAADSPYAVQPADSSLLIDCAGGEVVVTFPLAAAAASRRLTCKKKDATENAVKYTPQVGDTVEAESGSYDSITPGEFMTFVPDGGIDWARVG